MRLIWAVVCSKVSVDQQTNTISLFEVIEDVKFTTDGQLTFPTNVPFEGTLASTWIRDELNTPERAETAVRLINPDGRVLIEPEPHPVDFGDKARARVFAKFAGLPLSGPGTYHFEVCSRANDRSEWIVNQRIPIICSFEVVPSLTASTVPTQRSSTATGPLSNPKRKTKSTRR